VTEDRRGFINHINFYVRDISMVLPFYDALFEALMMTRATPRSAVATYVSRDQNGVRIAWFNLYEDPEAVPSSGRIAFRARSPRHVDEIRVRICEFAVDIEGPENIVAYDPGYYGLLFADALGNKFEVCHCELRR
jgi:hypothetical protein